jgi:hypothetical protein
VLVVDWVAVAIVLVGLAIAVELLGEVGNPARNCLLCLLETLLNVLANLWKVIYNILATFTTSMEYQRTIEEAMLSVWLVRPLSPLLPLLFALTLSRLATTLALVVFSQLSRIYLVLLELAALRPRWLWWRCLFSFEVGVRHACYGQPHVQFIEQVRAYSAVH